MTRPSVISRASLVRCSCARWMGFRVWKPATWRHPRAAISARSCRGVRRWSAKGRSRGQRQDADLARDEPRRAREQVGHARVGGVLRPVDEPGLANGVAPEDLADPDRAPESFPPVAERGFLAGLEVPAPVVVDREREGQRPHRAVGEAQPHQHARVVGLAEESLERARRAGGDQLEVGGLARVEVDRHERLRAGDERFLLVDGNEAVHERSAMGGHETNRHSGSLLAGQGQRQGGYGPPRVEAAFLLLVPAPAAGARVLSRQDRARAGDAPDARIPEGVQGAHGHVVARGRSPRPGRASRSRGGSP